MPKFPKNKHFLPPDMHTYVCVSGGKKCLFFGNFGVLCFLETLVLRFTLLPFPSDIKKHLEVQKKQNSLITKDYNFFLCRIYFRSNDGSQNTFVYQPTNT